MTLSRSSPPRVHVSWARGPVGPSGGHGDRLPLQPISYARLVDSSWTVRASAAPAHLVCTARGQLVDSSWTARGQLVCTARGQLVDS